MAKAKAGKSDAKASLDALKVLSGSLESATNNIGQLYKTMTTQLNALKRDSTRLKKIADKAESDLAKVGIGYAKRMEKLERVSLHLTREHETRLSSFDESLDRVMCVARHDISEQRAGIEQVAKSGRESLERTCQAEIRKIEAAMPTMIGRAIMGVRGL